MPASSDPAVAEFFNGWELYRAIIDTDSMEHRQVRNAIAPVLAERGAGFTLLDLGCGDAALLAPLAAQLPISRYTGVDVADHALACARGELAALGDRLDLRCAEMSRFLEDTTETFDVILVSFALHHLDRDAKRDFLARARSRLAPGGDLLLVDVVRRDGETRDEYLDRFDGLVADWPLSADHRERVIAHVHRNDFPEEVSRQPQWARTLGYEPVELYRGGCDTQAAWRFARV